jgi:uncharacterized protein (DUF885 family)
MPKNAKPDPPKELEKATIGELMGMLPAKHVWGLLVFIVGLIAGAFAFGHKISSWQSSIKHDQLAVEKVELEAEMERLKKDEIQPLIQNKERLKAKENIQRKFLLYQLAEVRKDADSNELRYAKSGLKNLTNLQQPEPLGRFASDAHRERYAAEMANYEAKLNEVYADLDDNGKQLFDAAKSKLQDAQQAYDEANAEYKSKAGDLSATIQFYESDERDRLGFALVTAVRGVENLATVTFLCDDTVFHLSNEILWPTAP